MKLDSCEVLIEAPPVVDQVVKLEVRVIMGTLRVGTVLRTAKPCPDFFRRHPPSSVDELRRFQLTVVNLFAYGRELPLLSKAMTGIVFLSGTGGETLKCYDMMYEE